MQRSIMDFRKISGCSQLWRERCRKRLKKYEALTGVKPIRVHDIRHSHVAYLIYQGVEPLIIKERLGHKRYSDDIEHLWASIPVTAEKSC